MRISDAEEDLVLVDVVRVVDAVVSFGRYIGVWPDLVFLPRAVWLLTFVAVLIGWKADAPVRSEFTEVGGGERGVAPISMDGGVKDLYSKVEFAVLSTGGEFVR